ncbi:beta-ketoacyl synthase [Litoricolaceae bacterium]|nr:beta-ketoacyl synthase [Litorivicinaceae bacterium]
MTALPLIVGFGGINAAGRSSDHQAFRRLIMDTLTPSETARTVNQIGALIGLGPDISMNEAQAQHVIENTLIRRIHPDWFNPDAVPFNRLGHTKETSSIWLGPLQIPNALPVGWSVGRKEGRLTEYVIEPGDLLKPCTRRLSVQAAGMAPTGFRPDMFYPSRNHPRTLQLALFALSDCWLSSGLQWHHIKHHIAPNQVAVFAGSSIGQMDESGFGGMLKSALLGKRTTSKQLPLGYPQMPADFSNAYVLGSLGRSGASMGACASFLYNLHNAVDGIQEGRYKVAIVGGADCPITPEVIEGFRAMGALAEDQGLRELDGLGDTDTPNYRRTSRPFGLNCGFTMGESSQYIILMDDQLALELGATIYGSVPTVASHADGGKRSISAPGAGNYLTLAQAAASIRDLLGQDVLAHETLVQAHGTSTPQNRVTESDVLSRVAQTFGIDQWMVSAVKSQLGHSQGTAGGDQLAVSLGAFASQIAPGIQTTETLAPDVIQQGLDFVLQSREQTLSAALINAKGFGGNNATAAVLSPEATATLLQSRHGPIQIAGSDEVRARQERYRHEIDRGTIEILYHYGENIVDGSDLEMTATSVSVPGFGHSMPLDQAKTKYSDLIKS